MLSTFSLMAITYLSAIVTLITGSVTIIGYFQHKPVSPSQPVVQPTSQNTQQTRPFTTPSQQYDQPPQPYGQTAQQIGHTFLPQKRNRLSHPRIALIALIGQVLLFISLAGYSYIGVNPGSGTPGLVWLTLFITLCGIVCAAIAFVMGLIKSKQLHRWRWFTSLIIGFFGLFILFLPALIPLLFGIFGPKEQKVIVKG